MNTYRKTRLPLGLRPSGSSLAVGLFVLLFVVSAPKTALSQDAAIVAERAGDAVVTLEVYDHAGSFLGQGSGFFLTDGRIVTNTHVVEGAARVDVFGAEEELLGSVSYAESLSSRVDVAILPRLGSVPGSLALAPTAPRVGESVVVIGAPLGLSHTVSNGIVSAERRMEGATLVQITAPISSGSSGGPVLNYDGEVIGVAVAILDGGQSINFAVPARDVRALASSPGGNVPFPAAGSSHADGTARAEAEPFRRSIDVGESSDGVLTAADADLDGHYLQVYDFSGWAGETITIELMSVDFDAYLMITDEEADWVEFDDDGGVGTDSRLTVTLPETGLYRIIATSYSAGETGEYRISLREGAQESVAQDDGWVWLSTTDAGEFSYRLDSLRQVRANVYEIWTRIRLSGPEGTGVLDLNEDTVLVLTQVNCRTRRTGMASYLAYDKGRVVDSEDFQTVDWSPVAPDSVGDSLWRAICES